MTEADDTRTFTVRVETVEQARRRMRRAARAIDDGGIPDEQYGLSLPTEDRLNQVLSETNIALLRLVASEEPSSINETARLADRDVHAVHDNLTQLADLGLIRFEEEGNARRPVVPYDDIEVDIAIRDAGDDTTPSKRKPGG
jgi:predicted transcriptional regulator